MLLVVYKKNDWVTGVNGKGKKYCGLRLGLVLFLPITKAINQMRKACLDKQHIKMLKMLRNYPECFRRSADRGNVHVSVDNGVHLTA